MRDIRTDDVKMGGTHSEQIFMISYTERDQIKYLENKYHIYKVKQSTWVVD